MSDKETIPPAVRVFEGELMRAEYARSVYTINGKPGTGPSHYLSPEAWAHVPETTLRQGDRIEITAEDRTWFAEIMVLLRKGSVIQLELLREYNFEAPAGREHEAYDVEWAGKSAKWRVLRKSDRIVMVDKLNAKSEAMAWIEENAKPTLKAA